MNRNHLCNNKIKETYGNNTFGQDSGLFTMDLSMRLSYSNLTLTSPTSLSNCFLKGTQFAFGKNCKIDFYWWYALHLELPDEDVMRHGQCLMLTPMVAEANCFCFILVLSRYFVSKTKKHALTKEHSQKCMLTPTTSEPLCVNNDYIDVWRRQNLYVLIMTILTCDDVRSFMC